ncbi:TIM23 complex component [Fusarium falciforme]|uniref:Presequence translocated-associated motor subunit PAM17 n=1 Tax=Fusarium falciforme TaxID=195108 RepID=A0A9W8R810_9HYPO|nr:TIM23 complex component [Fusarium falciforme]KAJ4209837.1 TIM23 complex component [Fusarium falciforme]KAJ4255916.1 TIM23 complex component [Fusarium falciforme]
MASSPLKTFVLRRPVTGVICSSPKAPFSTFPAAGGPVSCLARSPLRKQCLPTVVSVPKAFSRAASSGKPDLASAAQQSLNATPGQNNAHDFAQDPHHALDWNSFFKLRLKRRRYQLLFSITNGMFCGGAGAVVLSTGVAEPIITQIPLDPFMTLGIMTFAFSGLGWLIGPSIGNQVFYALNRKWKKQMTQKEAEFFERIKKHRVDPTNSSAANPVPDFYGEKIQSVAGYRQWLKDQKAFNKKKTANFV